MTAEQSIRNIEQVMDAVNAAGRNTPKPDPRADLVDLFEARAETHDDKSWIGVEEAVDLVMDREAETVPEVAQSVERERNEAWAVIQEFRAILSRPGKRIEACKRVLQNYSSDAHLVDIQRRERALYDPHAGIVKTFGSHS